MEQDRFEHPIRDGFETDAFVVRPLREAHASLDYAAVMESRDDLRRSSLGTWPRDGFTLEENRRDLARHEREHNDGSSFTYTVIGPDGSECLGCVYVTPLPTHLVRVGAPRELVNTATWSQAAVFFWVRSQRIRGGLEPQLLSALRSWFRLDWRGLDMLISTHTKDPRQVRLYRDAGLTVRIRTSMSHGNAEFLYYEEPASRAA